MAYDATNAGLILFGVCGILVFREQCLFRGELSALFACFLRILSATAKPNFSTSSRYVKRYSTPA
jgi:hypothetical protein